MDSNYSKKDDDISLHWVLDKDEEMNMHAKDLAFLEFFGKEIRPKKHKKQNKPISPLVLNLMILVKGCVSECEYYNIM